MARIAGIDLPRDKRIEAALPYVYGIGGPSARGILVRVEVNPDTRVRDLSDEEVARIREVVEKEFRVEGDLRRELQMNIKRLIDIGSYRGRRHRQGLPVRGQRTKTNARTRKGPRRTVGAKRKK